MQFYHSLIIFLIENYCLCSACCLKLFSCQCLFLSHKFSWVLFALWWGTAAGYSCALETNIPIFIHVQIVFALKPNGSVSCISVPWFGLIGLACESCSDRSLPPWTSSLDNLAKNPRYALLGRAVCRQQGFVVHGGGGEIRSMETWNLNQFEFKNKNLGDTVS